MSRLVVIVASIAALIGWGGLALQFAILVPKLGVLGGAWRFLGFFTILTNLGAALVATSMVVRPNSALADAKARLMAATSILMVGLVYSVALRATWNPTGLQAVVDKMLHDLAPLSWLILWLVAPHPRLAWKDIFWALIPPVAYVVYALGRGSVENWYAYWFLDPANQTSTQFALSLIILVVGFTAAAALLISVDRWLGRRADASLNLA